MVTVEIILPVFNEEECIGETFSRLSKLRNAISDKIDVSLIFVDDGSKDSSASLIAELAKNHQFVRLIEFSRNFGHQIAITAGINHSQADWVVTIDADLQDPPELVEDMLALALSNNLDVVYARRSDRRGETYFKRITADLFYRLIQRLSDVEIPRDVGDYRLISRRVADELNQLDETHRFVRGLVPWVGFNHGFIDFERAERHAGVTKYPLRKMLAFAANGILSFSSKPLLISVFIGFFFIMLSIAWGCFAFVNKVFFGNILPGYTALMIAITLFSGIQLLLLGITGQYVARIFEEVKRRPLYVIKK